MLGVSAVITLLTAGYGIDVSMNYQKVQASQSASSTVQGRLLDAVQRARSSVNGGATMVFTQDSYNEVQFALYDGVPDASQSMSANPIEGPWDLTPNVTIAAPGVSQSTPIAIIINTDGTSALASWRPGKADLASEPNCTGNEELVFAWGTASTTSSLNCATTQLQ